MSKAPLPSADTSMLARQIETTPGLARLRDCVGPFGEVEPDLVAAVLTEAQRFADTWLGPLNASADRNAPRLVDGHVQVSADHRAAWQAFVEGGWNAIDFEPEIGGQGLPLLIAVAVQQLFDRSHPAFGMLAVSTRSAARLLSASGDESLRQSWLPRMAAGDWTASICISEAGAGSDLGRMRTRAHRQADGSWTVTGEKQWISFGDHDLSERIGHCVLARTEATKGLSLFLVPDRLEDGNRNAVFVRRIEDKLGLHQSPTCAIGFEDAQAVLLSEEGRGLADIFVMIVNMRLAVAATGVGIASGAADLALQYAGERRQGGGGAEPTLLAEHADVQRMLLSMSSDAEVLRGLVYATAVQADLARLSPDEAERNRSSALLQWLLPLIKTVGGETAFRNASGAIQVLGGAGYTTEWPAEQALRDARVLTIFEGTSGMQALDLLHRRLWRDRGLGLLEFLDVARADLAGAPRAGAAALELALDRLDEVAGCLMELQDRPREAEAGAVALLDLAGLAARGWIAVRLSKLGGEDAASTRLAALGEYWLTGLDGHSAAARHEALLGADRLRAFSHLQTQ